jgi:hypothetical protein
MKSEFSPEPEYESKLGFGFDDNFEFHLSDDDNNDDNDEELDG